MKPSLSSIAAGVFLTSLAVPPVNAWFTTTLLPSRPTKLFAAVAATGVVAPAEIVGSGRIGSLLAQPGSCTIIGRNDPIDPNKTGQPIIVTTRNDALPKIIENCPAHRRADLVFVQNGYLDPLLQSYDGLFESATQVLLYLSVPKLGAKPVDGVTTVSPDGLTAACGPHAAAFAERLAAVQMKCNVVDATAYRPAMFEKLIWISTYMLVGTAKECATVGIAGKDYRDTVVAVMNELLAAVSAKEGITFPDGAIARLEAYTDTVADFPCGLKEFEFRNQYFYKLGCKLHNALLEECRQKKLLSFELPLLSLDT